MPPVSIIEHPTIEFLDLRQGFDNLLESFQKSPYPGLKYRLEGLDRLEKMILSKRSEIREVLKLDFKKPYAQTDTSEILPCLVEIRKAKKELKYWIRRKQISNPTEMLGTRSYLQFEPKGVVLILSPWNYPLNLCIVPLVAAWSAGNKIILKPSEFSPHTSRLISEIIDVCFAKDEVQVYEGDSTMAEFLIKLPFHHVFFTGSQEKARKILKMTADRLIPVTLELGGKTPVIVDEDVDLKKIVKDIAFAKCINAGQTCIAPDFILLPEKLKASFQSEWNLALEEFYGKNILLNDQYCGIIHKRHFDKLCNIIYQSLEQGAQADAPLECDPVNLKMKPILLWNTDWNHVSMEAELFGPILPVLTYNDTADFIPILNKMYVPLTLYLFSNNKSWLEHLKMHVRSGGVNFNNCLLNYCNFNLPFGGLRESGVGYTHGRYGFETFSHQRAISVQGKWLNLLRFFHPPYSNFKQKLIDLFVKFIGKI